MYPTLRPGDGLVGLRGGTPRTGQLRLFRHPHKSTLWLVKRVGEVYGTVFEARSDNPRAPGASDSHDFGPVSAAGTYRVVWTARGSSSTRR
ncbi:putative phage repressor [Mycolicibacterium aurum]|uniref:Putative phage repressor n=2 Tax=Mycolicibacterium aurum TaxID=1791 RepID=A0A448J1D3_MYCAU|nr:putative phage repressor [Mycolicibacterium aurum]